MGTNLLPEWMCKRITEVAAKLKVEMAEVERVMKEIVAKGITKIHEIIEELKKHFFPHLEKFVLEESLEAITCEDILSDKVCAELREIAKKMKLEAEVIDKFIREALEKGKRKVNEIIAYIREKMVALSKITCEDVISKTICDKIREVAAKLKIKFDAVMKVMKQAIAQGLSKIKDIIDYIKKHFFPQLEGELENVIVCEEVLSEKVCKELREIAEKLKLGAKVIDQFIQEALEKGKRKASEIIAYIREKMVAISKITCEDVISKSICDKIREVAAKLKIKFDAVMKVMKQAIAQGLSKIKDIIDYIKKHFFP